MTVNEHPLADADELCRLGVSELTAGYAAGTFTPVEAARATLARAEAINPAFNAFTLVDHDRALTAAKASAERWRRGEPVSPIDGVPTTIKDIVWVEGLPIRYGSRTTDPTPQAADSPVAARLKAAGAVVIGLTTTPEFGWKAITDSPLSGITRNPWAPAMTPGGSSGGAAVAAATGAGVLHVGTDGGGSIRIPSSFTGIVGLKPTFGRVAANPASPFGTVAHIGPMARDAEDASAMLAAIAGRDLSDWAQGAGDLGPLGLTEGVLRGARIGYWATPPCGFLDAEVKAAVDAAVARLEALGARIEPVSLPTEGGDLLDLFHHHWFTGAATRLAGVPADRHDMVDPGLREIAAAGARYGSVDLVTAQVRRGAFGAAMDRLLAAFDFLVSPGTAIPAFAAGEEVPPGSGLTRWTQWAGFSFPINLSQQPAAVVPCGRTADGRPIALQVVGARGADGRVLSAVRDIERAMPSLAV